MSPSRVCCTCKKPLSDQPAIFVDDMCYCFYHAKRAYASALISRENIATEQKKHIDSWFSRTEQHGRELTDWFNRRSAYSSHTGFSACLILAIYFLGVLFFWQFGMTAGMYSIVGMGFIVNRIAEYTRNFKGLEFDRRFPRPELRGTCPEHPPVPKIRLQQHPENDDPHLFNAGYDRREIISRDRNQCQNCGIRFKDDEVEVHHVNPFSKRGTDSRCNLITLCLKCHIDEEWFGHRHKKRPSFPSNQSS